ncbi:MAG: cation:proton antiporter [Pseudomonadota bacterium]
MKDISLLQVTLFLGAAAVAAPLAKWLRVGTVLGYLGSGILIGPYGIGSVSTLYEAQSILHFAEFGVVLLLFLIGLELRPKRLWSMRTAIFGLGGAQVGVSAVLLAAAGMVFGLAPLTALFVGLCLALSSTAFALQVMEEKGELATQHGRAGFANLLFQDLAAIPLIALVPLFAISGAVTGAGDDGGAGLWAAAKAIGTIIGVIVVGYFALEHAFRLVARTGVKEAMTASALLVVVGVQLIMNAAGLSPSLGGFLAGALLAESSYRHQIEADIQPFEGLLLGLFFVAIGMSLNLGLLIEQPLTILALVAGLLAIKAAVLYGVGRWWGLSDWSARRYGLTLSQGGEFAFVLFTAGVAQNAIAQGPADLLTVVVTLSMAATPILLLSDSALFPKPEPASTPYDDLPDHEGHVIIAGFGRFGQIVARVLAAKRIPFTALDASASQVDFVKGFGNKVYYGDASRRDILDAADTGAARAFVLAIDDVEASLRTAQVVREHFPDLEIYARARNRNHAHRLMDLGVKIIHRETFASALEITRALLQGLGDSQRQADWAVDTFKELDVSRLHAGYESYSDKEKQRELAKSGSQELEEMFQQDAADRAKEQGKV